MLGAVTSKLTHKGPTVDENGWNRKSRWSSTGEDQGTFQTGVKSSKCFHKLISIFQLIRWKRRNIPKRRVEFVGSAAINYVAGIRESSGHSPRLLTDLLALIVLVHEGLGSDCNTNSFLTPNTFLGEFHVYITRNVCNTSIRRSVKYTARFGGAFLVAGRYLFHHLLPKERSHPSPLGDAGRQAGSPCGSHTDAMFYGYIHARRQKTPTTGNLLRGRTLRWSYCLTFPTYQAAWWVEGRCSAVGTHVCMRARCGRYTILDKYAMTMSRYTPMSNILCGYYTIISLSTKHQDVPVFLR